MHSYFVESSPDKRDNYILDYPMDIQDILRPGDLVVLPNQHKYRVQAVQYRLDLGCTSKDYYVEIFVDKEI